MSSNSWLPKAFKRVFLRLYVLLHIYDNQNVQTVIEINITLQQIVNRCLSTISMDYRGYNIRILYSSFQTAISD